MMRLLRKTIVIGLAALGIYKAWELVSPRIDAARGKTAQARDRVEPVLRDAKDTVTSASRDAAGSLVDASRDAVGTVTDAVEEAAHGITEATTNGAGSPSAVETGSPA